MKTYLEVFCASFLAGLILIVMCTSVKAQNFPTPKATPQRATMNLICDNSSRMLFSLKKEYNETPALSGIIGVTNSQIFQLLFNPKTKGYTVIISSVNGISCFITSGGPLIVHDYFKIINDDTINK